MRGATAAVVVTVLIACKHEPSKSEPAPPPVADAAPAPIPVAPGCAIHFSLAAGGLDWTAGDRAGAMADGISDRAVADAVHAAGPAGSCTATIEATDTTTYQDVVTVMNAAIVGGARAILLDAGGPSAAAPLAPGGDKPGPTITITPEAVKVSGTDVAKLDDPQLDHLLGDVLDAKQAKQPGAKAVIQADQATPWKHLAEVIRAARAAGYTDLLFATKNQ